MSCPKENISNGGRLSTVLSGVENKLRSDNNHKKLNVESRD